MLDAIFSAMYSSGPLQWAGAFLWGVASVILSPCGIAAIPLVVGYIENTDNPSRWEAFKISCAFCSGIVLNLMLVGFVTSSFGLLLGGNERFLTLFVAVVFILMGLHLTGLVHFKFFSFGGGGSTERRGLWGALILGVVSGLAIGPCSIAYITPVLSLAAAQASRGLAFSFGLIAAYALGYSAVLVAAGTFAQLASGWLQSERGQTTLRVLNFVCGVVLIGVGIYLGHSVLYVYFA
ncbi:cytochrome c biogenesis CcdA family protein [Fretibacterium sp. OH1220_COT-178]|uniref:cytochrome c biogenesis CcdA family protein n=1 Tax=Fretibacterium sp. OH1220_COT-178 TaxID=2491047 RepID=UPI000F5E99F6|nr:cytochrome c biogenesis protein CcdA [Fretibacterium sp. OH1220_COT-178]RRD64449.1 cytochrome C biogenesis protein [Fretibacterium sp. OH1220_COT-178]